MPLSDWPNSNSSPEASRNLSLWTERALRGRSGVILDDQSLLDGNGERDLVAFGQAGERALHLVLVPVQVHGGLGRDLERFTDRDEVAALLADLDRLTRLHVRTGNVDPPSVHEHVAVGHELASLALGQRESQAKDDDVQPRLQLPDELLAGHAGPPGGPVVIEPHLALPDTVDRTELLLLQEPDLVLGQALAAPAVLPRRIGTLVGRAVGAATERRADPAAGAMSRSELVHADSQRTNREARSTATDSIAGRGCRRPDHGERAGARAWGCPGCSVRRPDGGRGARPVAGTGASVDGPATRLDHGRYGHGPQPGPKPGRSSGIRPRRPGGPAPGVVPIRSARRRRLHPSRAAPSGWGRLRVRGGEGGVGGTRSRGIRRQRLGDVLRAARPGLRGSPGGVDRGSSEAVGAHALRRTVWDRGARRDPDRRRIDPGPVTGRSGGHRIGRRRGPGGRGGA